MHSTGGPAFFVFVSRGVFSLCAGLLGLAATIFAVFDVVIPRRFLAQEILGAALLLLLGIVVDLVLKIRRLLLKAAPSHRLMHPLPKGGIDVPRLRYLDVDHAVDVLVDTLQNSKFSPQVVVGVDRGGAVLAGMLAKRLALPSTTISSQGRWTLSDTRGSLDKGIRDGKKSSGEPIHRMLLVDDVCRSGSTLSHANDFLTRLFAGRAGTDIRQACILNELKPHGPGKSITPTYSVYETNRRDTGMPWDPVRKSASSSPTSEDVPQ